MGRYPARRRHPDHGGRKRGLQKALETELSQEAEALLGPESLADFEALETLMRQRALALAARLVAHRLNADTSDNVTATLPCSCGRPARYAGRKTKHFHTVLGVMELSRAYYHCSKCEAGFCPRDRALGMDESSLSPALVRMTGAVGAAVSFHEGSNLLWELAGVRLDPKCVERSAERLGAEVARDERVVATPLDHSPLPPTPVHGRRRHRHPHASP